MKEKTNPIGLNLCVAAVLSLTAMSAAHALLIDQATFKQNGGNPVNVPGTIKAANKKLADLSKEAAWRSVGRLDLAPVNRRLPGISCTATWIGDAGRWSYFMTAAHCLAPRGGRPEMPVSARFTDWSGRTVAGGRGTAYFTDPNFRPGVLVKTQTLGNGASGQLAIVKLPRHDFIKDRFRLTPIEPPIINDIADEIGRDTIFVGYGMWGVGPNRTAFSHNLAVGDGRLYGRSRVDGVSSDGLGLIANYQPAGPSSHWAQITPGDDGAAWWQIHGTRPTIVAVTDAGAFNLSAAVRVAKFTDWIKSVYPQARFLSQVKPRACLVNALFGVKYCLSEGQESYNGDGKWTVMFSGMDLGVQADDGVAVQLSTDRRMDAVGSGKSAEFVGTVESSRLKHVKANDGQYRDFSRPNAMRVRSSGKPLGCIVSLDSAQKYCLPAGQQPVQQLPAWIKGQDVFVQADQGVAVRLSDRPNFAYNRVATFSGTVSHDKLIKVRADNGEDLDFSRPVSMEVIQH